MSQDYAGRRGQNIYPRNGARARARSRYAVHSAWPFLLASNFPSGTFQIVHAGHMRLRSSFHNLRSMTIHRYSGDRQYREQIDRPVSRDETAIGYSD